VWSPPFSSRFFFFSPLFFLYSVPSTPGPTPSSAAVPTDSTVFHGLNKRKKNRDPPLRRKTALPGAAGSKTRFCGPRGSPASWKKKKKAPFFPHPHALNRPVGREKPPGKQTRTVNRLGATPPPPPPTFPRRPVHRAPHPETVGYPPFARHVSRCPPGAHDVGPSPRLGQARWPMTRFVPRYTTFLVGGGV